MTEDFADILAARAAEAGIPLTDRQLEQFSRYNALLLRWNERMNLTALTSPEDVAVKHIVDSLAAYDEDLFARAQTLVDVGTGAGFPGLPLAIYAPHVAVTLMDALKKRIAFLEEAVRELRLTNVACIHARAEGAARTHTYREQYDIAVSRAVARLPVLVEYALPFVRIGGTFLALKGRVYRAEMAESMAAVRLIGGGEMRARPVSLPGLDDVRAVVYIRKERSTPDAYPRRAGLPGKEPLGRGVGAHTAAAAAIRHAPAAAAGSVPRPEENRAEENNAERAHMVKGYPKGLRRRK